MKLTNGLMKVLVYAHHKHLSYKSPYVISKVYLNGSIHSADLTSSVVEFIVRLKGAFVSLEGHNFQLMTDANSLQNLHARDTEPADLPEPTSPTGGG